MSTPVNAEKLGSIVQLLASVAAMLDGGYHYSSPVLRSRGDTPDQPPPMVRMTADVVGLLGEIVVDLGGISAMLAELDDQAKQLQVDANSLCGADLALTAKLYEQLAIEIRASLQRVTEGFLRTNGESTKPERKARATGERKRRNSTAEQTSLPTGENVPDASDWLEPDTNSRLSRRNGESEPPEAADA